MSNNSKSAFNEELEQALDYNYKLGISSGLEKASSIVLTEATKLFVANQDKEATLLRSLSHTLLAHSKEVRPERKVDDTIKK